VRGVGTGLIAFLVVALLGGTALGDTPCEAARNLLEDGWLAQAEPVFSSLLTSDLDPACGREGLRTAEANRLAAVGHVERADALEADGRTDEARSAYEDALALDRGNEAAQEGVEATATSEDGLTQRVLTWWRSLWKDTLEPLGIALGQLVLVLVVVGALLRSLGRALAHTPFRRFPPGLATIAVLTLLGFAAIVHVSRTALWHAVVTLILVVGAATIAAGALPRRVVIETLVGDGAAEDGGPIRARMQSGLYDIGGADLQGHEIVTGTDVTQLPASVADLSSNKVLAALAQVLQALTPATTYRVRGQVHRTGDEPVRGLSLTLHRDRRTLDSVTLRPEAYEVADAAQKAERPSADDLALAGAAWLLVRLQRETGEVTTGLAGASEWTSVALQVVAERRHRAGDLDSARKLFARAVDEDPKNRAAELGLLMLRLRLHAGEPAETGTAKRTLVRLARLRDREAKVTSGELAETSGEPAETDTAKGDAEVTSEGQRRSALWLRASSAYAVGALNLRVLDPATDWEDELPCPGKVLRDLVGAVDGLLTPAPREPRSWLKPRRDPLREFAEAIRPNVAILAAGGQLPRPSTANAGHADADRPPENGRKALERKLADWQLDGRARYNLACFHAQTGHLDRAIDALEEALESGELRSVARGDPTLEPLREGPHAARFHRLVGGDRSRAPSRTVLGRYPWIGRYAVELEHRGIVDLRQLEEATAEQQGRRLLAEELALEEEVVQLWHDRATLSRLDELTARRLELLVLAGVSSLQDLASRSPERLARTLRAFAAASGTPAPNDTDVRRWIRKAAGRT
jgi:tetratricopeptide (TPR) repeat protein